MSTQRASWQSPCLSFSFLRLFSRSGRVTAEDEVAIRDECVAGEAGREHRRVGGLAIVELREPPAAGRGVLLRVLDHELNAVHRGAGHEGLSTAEGLVVLLRREVLPGDADDDRAVGERLAFA